MSGGLNMGLHLVNYSNFSENSISIRPEIGGGGFGIRFGYGYNFSLTNKDMEGVNKHIFTIQFSPNLKNIKKEKNKWWKHYEELKKRVY